jgi:hypothetical protein
MQFNLHIHTTNDEHELLVHVQKYAQVGFWLS